MVRWGDRSEEPTKHHTCTAKSIEDKTTSRHRILVLRPGMRAFVIEKSARRIRFWVDGNEHILAPVLAQNVSIKPLPEFRTEEPR